MKSSTLNVRRVLVKALIAVALVLGALAPITGQAVLAAGCNGSDCFGLNPNSMGCGADAATSASYTFSGGNKVENRYSVVCNAEWERTTNLSGYSRYAAGSIRWGCANYCQHLSVRSPGTISNYQYVYTSMLGPDGGVPALSCGKLATTGPISPLPITQNCGGPT